MRKMSFMDSRIPVIWRLIVVASVVLLLLFSEKIGSPVNTLYGSWEYSVSFPDPGSKSCNISLTIRNCTEDSLLLKIPVWMPGYYQVMNYPSGIHNLTATVRGDTLQVSRIRDDGWLILNPHGRKINVEYTVVTGRKFVATSYVDADHAYLVPGSCFLYPDGNLDMPLEIDITLPEGWANIATGLKESGKAPGRFTAPDFDILYDSPILAGTLEELAPFMVDGVNHRFVAYNPGSFNRDLFMKSLHLVVEAATDLIGHIPYEEYTFIGIGAGFGGIEHLNNTTVSFRGDGLDTPESMTGMLSFLAHEYFHHYNVKRIRPYELGPFDYSGPNRTYQLWISEGITVYYESVILRKAGIITADEMLADFAGSINGLENDPGRHHQTLAQAGYGTWEYGPFGGGGGSEDRSISVYTKGAVVGMLLDLEIRYATNSESSLDDVMRALYYRYYLEKGRGFTGSEFRQVCEEVAGQSLADLFEYVYTTREIDYEKYLGYAGLELRRVEQRDDRPGTRVVIVPANVTDPSMDALREAWLNPPLVEVNN